MHGASHLILSWGVAEAARLPTLRERRIVTWAGILPDADVLVYGAGMLYFRFDMSEAFRWHRWVHHRYTHGIAFIFLTTVLAYLLARHWAGRRPGWEALRIALLAGGASVLHDLADLVGSGPGWPLYPLWPLSARRWEVSWSFNLADWRNTLICGILLFGAYLYGRRVGRTPLEAFSKRLDRWFVRALRRGTPEPRPSRPA